MKKIKIILILLVIIFVGIVGYQNKSYFMAAQSFNLNIKIANYQSPEIRTGVLLAACFLIGFLISYFSNLLERFKSSRQVKNLNAAQITHLETVKMLEAELASIKNRAVGPDDAHYSDDHTDESAGTDNEHEESPGNDGLINDTQQV